MCDVGQHHGQDLTLLRIDEKSIGKVMALPVEIAGTDGGKSGLRRERRRTLRVVVSDAEQAEIARRAAETSLSVSAYLRALGLGYAPKSTLDQRAIGELVKVHANQGRLGGLLKLWLVEKPGQGAPAFDVRRLLSRIEALQEQLKAIVADLRGRRG
jgi:hypothetical protein